MLFRSSGFAAITGEADGPPTLPPFGLADGIAALTTAFAIMAAIQSRHATGRGQVVAGKARPLALTLPERSPLYPDLPTLAASFPGFTSTGFLAIAVPKATPLPIQEKLNTLINEAISNPTIKDRLINEFALTAQPLTLAQCAAQDREERAKWAEYVKIAKIEPQ